MSEKEKLVKFLIFRKQHPELNQELTFLYDKFNRTLITIDELLQESYKLKKFLNFYNSIFKNKK